MTTIVQLTASRFFGGPERQMLELARALPESYRTVFAAFSEEGLCERLLARAENGGFEAIRLPHDFPRLWAARRDLIRELKRLSADVLCCHGYKANLVGLWAARHVRIPVVSVSRGWTAETRRVRLYEILDRRVLRWMDRVVAVSNRQADKVCAVGVLPEKTRVIHNAVRIERFQNPDPEYRIRLEGMFPRRPALIVGAAGRLSPEKGFGVLVEAAADVVAAEPSTGFVLFGEGSQRDDLDTAVRRAGLQDHFLAPGFAGDLDGFLPHFDLLALPSFTEGLPNVALEASAAGVPVVATAVGGTPEVIADGITGRLVPAGDSQALGRAILGVLRDDKARQRMGQAGLEQVNSEFTFCAQAKRYERLFDDLLETRPEVQAKSTAASLRRTLSWSDREAARNA